MLIYRSLAREISKRFGLEKYRNPITSIIVLFFPLTTCVLAILFYNLINFYSFLNERALYVAIFMYEFIRLLYDFDLICD